MFRASALIKKSNLILVLDCCNDYCYRAQQCPNFELYKESYSISFMSSSEIFVTKFSMFKRFKLVMFRLINKNP